MNKKKCSNLAVVFCLALFPSWAAAQDQGSWVESTGEAFIRNITAEEAYSLALQRARQDAVEKACGVSVQSETLVRNFMTAGDFVHAISQGRVVEEQIFRWEIVPIPADNPERPPGILARVFMNARVLSETGEEDPGFRIGLEMEKREFRSGDKTAFWVQASKDCHATVLCLAANDSVYVLFPNPMQSENFLKAGERIRVPANGFITVSTLPGHSKDSEVVLALATKQNVRFFHETDADDEPGAVGTPKFAAMKLARILAGIPKSERAEDSKVYTVTSE
ncbi:DUF4384 domain-containing protein [bacterium]|nr:DUF4384 domain-containing protein [bacterium]